MLSSGAKSVIITSTELETAKNKLVLLAKNRNGEHVNYSDAVCNLPIIT